MKVVLAGGSGSLGRRLAPALSAAGHEAVVLTRGVPVASAVRQVQWDGCTVDAWADELNGAAVINLAGELVDRRPTPAAIDLLTRSRVEPTRALVAASHAVSGPPRVWLQLSTLAIYGDAGEAELADNSRPADGPPQMAGVARAWEAATEGARAERLVILRTGVVFDRDTPALDRLAKLARWGLGGRIASGQQWVSWLHINDFVGAALSLLATSSLDGIVHVTSPTPVRNVEMMKQFRRTVNRPASPPTPAALVHVGAAFLRTDPALALTGRRCVPQRLLADGFRFRYPTLDLAIDDLLSSPTTAGKPGR
jgi:uncharacterized protein